MDPDYFCTHRIIHGRFQSKDISTKSERPCAARPARSELRSPVRPHPSERRLESHTSHAPRDRAGTGVELKEKLQVR